LCIACNDYDISGDSFFIEILETNENIEIININNPSVDVVLAPIFNDTILQFTYRICKEIYDCFNGNTLLCDTSLVTININLNYPYNTPPVVFYSDTFLISTNTIFELNLMDFLNDEDINDMHSFSILDYNENAMIVNLLDSIIRIQIIEETNDFFVVGYIVCDDGFPIECDTGYLYFYTPLQVDINILNHVSCLGFSDAEISIIFKGGIAPYFTNFTNENLYDLSAGEYFFEINDSYNSSFQDSIIITQPEDELFFYFNVEQNTNSFDISTIVSGGTPPYSYLWNTNENTTSIQSDNFNSLFSLNVQDNNGCLFNNSIFISINDVFSNENQYSFTIFPNPTKNYFYVRLNEENNLHNYDIQIIDLNGKILYESKILNEKIDISSFCSGYYLIKINNKDSIFFVQKLIVLE